MRPLVFVLLLAAAGAANDWPEPLRGAPWAAGGDGLKAAPRLLRTRDPRLKELYRFRIARFRVDGATLAAAAAELTRVSGVTVEGEGAAKPISLDLADVGFWDAVLAICRAGDVGLAPHPHGHRHGKWMPGFGGHRVVLGAAFPRPVHAVADGPVLVVPSARMLVGERAGALELQVRWVPELPVRGMTEARVVDGRDHER